MSTEAKRLITIIAGFIGFCLIIGIIAQIIINQAQLPMTESQARSKGLKVDEIKQQMDNPQSITDVSYVNFEHLNTIGIPITEINSIYRGLLKQFPTTRRYELIKSSVYVSSRQAENDTVHDFGFDFKIDDKTYAAKGSYGPKSNFTIQFYQNQKLISASL